MTGQTTITIIKIRLINMKEEFTAQQCFSDIFGNVHLIKCFLHRHTQDNIQHREKPHQEQLGRLHAHAKRRRQTFQELGPQEGNSRDLIR